MDRTIREKKHRLPKENYLGQIIVAVTINVYQRKVFFVTDGVFKLFEGILLEEMESYFCDAHVYLFMPDHCHLLLQGKSDNSDILKMLKIFKQKTGYWLSQNKSDYKWQKDFYDHILRKDDDIPKQINYILQNPVRKELVSDWRGYPYKGSTIHNLSEWVQYSAT